MAVSIGNMVDKGTETVFTRGMEATTTQRLVNLNPVAAEGNAAGSVITYVRKA